jgi:nicotinamidase/pyrazinamidase
MEFTLNELEKITVVYNKTASHNVDPQKGFTPLCSNELPVPDGHLIVDELNKQNSIVKFKTVSKDMHPANAIWIANEKQPQFSPVSGENVDIAWNSHCMSGTVGAELIDGLPRMSEYDFMVAKGFEKCLHPYSSCYHDLGKKISTGLIEWYKSKDISTVIVGGLATNYCVGSTVIDLVEAGFQVILNLGACKGIGTEEEINNYVNMLVEKYNVLIVNSADEIEIVGLS